MSPSSSLTQVHQPRGSGSGGTPSFNKSARLLRPTTLPIPVLSSSSSSVAKRYAVAHTLAVPLYYYLRASALVADPLPTLITDLIVVGAAQAIFCALCLPSAGTWVSGTTGGKIIEGTATTTTSTTTKTSKGSSAAGGSMRKKGGHGGGGGGGGKISTSKGGFGDGGAAGGNISSRIMPTLFSLILTLTLPPLPLTVMALVLGAPLYPTSLIPHTAVLALHVSMLGFLPIFYTHGVSSAAWRDVAAAWLPFDEAGVWAGTVGALVGGWVGAVPMALDWDRDWQKWPCTVLWGCVLGWVIGRVLTGVLGFGVGERINLSETQGAEEVEVATTDTKRE
ncbi:uncharacterized protein PV06_07189 [Exophiala oligosperma]|uniref:Glycosylphosphatidylinositol anchor biosynthesis protein 11 n=1 Tax=Exophiala oligosperma TaxID=215243 RepID=A0A0D2BW26_9EURO|nr:uncharacterized protein PV06_07189 [Exophiala oligosperma]KIW41652.1 hypothetical protein PV06_07189 [Exophiala oligosperma]